MRAARRWIFSARFRAGRARATPARALASAWAVALGRLQRLPARAGRGVAEDVRVAADHLGADRRQHVVEREGAALLGDAGVIDDLELEIAELVLQRRHVAAADRVGDLIGFLDRVGRDRLEGLDLVPFAAGLADRAAGP